MCMCVVNLILPPQLLVMYSVGLLRSRDVGTWCLAVDAEIALLCADVVIFFIMYLLLLLLYSVSLLTV